ncbi:hypothetical protein EDC01DRAFT_163273 [Geopyxis carbonaria]|nr:hypothetical protein EDC01DRAFT_163273 [Geopyxis carbonaria]
MENRFPIHDSRLSASSALGHRYDEEEIGRNSLASSSVPSHRNSTAVSSYHTPSLAERDDSVNDFDTTSAPQIHNVFATPTHSEPVSPSASMVDVNVFSTPPPSIYRNSFSLSLPRSPSPIPVADGHRGSYYAHNRSLSLSRSVTPSLSTSSEYTGPTLNRSNTTGTSNSSTLYSIPSHMSQISSPPSPLQAIPSQRPQFNYNGHQQTLSIHDSELDEVEDPFIDGFVVPVGDGFAPHRVPRGPSSSAASDVGTISLPPPYTQYAELQAPKPEHGVGIIAMRSAHSSGNSASSILGDSEGQRQSRGAGVVLPAIGVGVADGQGVGTGAGAGAGAENESGADHSGAHKEWKEKKWMGGRIWVMVASGLVALLVGLAVGLGVGLGIGYKKGSSSSDLSPSLSTTYTATASIVPAPENTGPPTFDRDNNFIPIPEGPSFISPLQLDSYSSSCAIVADDPSAPDFFKQGSGSLWACGIPKSKPLLWNFVPLPGNLSGKQLSDLNSDPKPIACAEYSKGRWGGYSISSETGENAQEKDIVWVDQEGQKVLYAGPAGWREGMQGPAFWKEPLTLFDPSTDVGHSKRSDLGNSSLSYRFGILYTKTVILREKSLITAYEENKPLDQIEKNETDPILADGEVVWMCEWEKTLLEVEIMVREPSIAVTQKGRKIHGMEGTDLNDDDDRKTTITIGPSSFPTFTSQSSSQPPPPPPPPFESPPPAYPSASPSIEEEDDDNPTRLRRRGSIPPRDYPNKIKMSEYRPSKIRLKDVQGIDRTEGDNDPRVKYGNIKCTKMVVVPGGGLRNDTGADGEGEVWLKQRPLSSKRKRSQDAAEDSDCFCKWSS